jgi:hypothetical protein
MDRFYTNCIGWISVVIACFPNLTFAQAAQMTEPSVNVVPGVDSNYSFTLSLGTTFPGTTLPSSTTLQFYSRLCNQSQELQLTRKGSSTFTGQLHIPGECPDWKITYADLERANLVYYSFSSSLQNLIGAGPKGMAVSATPATASFDMVMNEAIQKNVPESDRPGYVEYRMKMNQEILKGTWNQSIPKPQSATSASCSNVDFENGDLSSWNGFTGLNPGCCLTPGFIAGRQTITSGAGVDACGGFPVVCPGGSYSLMLGAAVSGGLAEQITQTFTVSASSTNFTYKYAVVLQDPGHAVADQPFFKVEMLDQYGNLIPCSLYFVAAGQGIPGFQNSGTCGSVVFKPWTTVSVDLSAYINQPVTIRFTAADCTLGGHYGYAYVDGSCLPLALSTTGDVCAGGSVTLTAPAGSASYSWSPGGQTTPSITVSTAGTYTCVLTSVQGCNISLTVPVNIFPVPTSVFSNASTACSPVFTFQDASVVSIGSISTWSWNFGDGTFSSAQNPSHTYPGPGTYTVSLTVTTASGCSNTSSHIITIPSPPLVILNETDVLCFGGNTGSLNATISGGQTPYTFSWSNNVSTSLNSNVPAGTYSLTVTSSNGCITQATASVAQPTQLALTTGQSGTTCYGGTNGSASVIVSGGTIPYTYSWNTIPLQSSAQAGNLSAGTYTVVVTDGQGCVSRSPVTIAQPAVLQVSPTPVVPVSCFGGTNGSLGVVANGGTAPYTYSWNTSPAQTGNIALNLPAGTYQAGVHDANGCTTLISQVVTQPALLAASVFANTGPLCFGGTDGTAQAGASGGTAPFQYSWNTVPSQNTSSAGNLTAGNYSVQVTDAHGCVAASSVLIGQPVQLTVTLQSGNPLCFGASTGWTSAAISGGVIPYTYSWSGTTTTLAVAQNLSAGTYSVQVTDKNGCRVSGQATITQPSQISAQPINEQNVSCYGGSDGSATELASGGTAPYTYTWNTNPVQNTSTAQSIGAGIHSLIIHDARGCQLSINITVLEPPMLNPTVLSSTGPSCFGGTNGTLASAVAGGTPPYQYSWNTVPAQTTPYAINLAAGTYQLTVTDSKGCVSKINAPIVQPSQLQLSATSGNVSCYGASTGWVSGTSGGGTTPYTYYWSPINANTPVVSGLPAGAYLLTVRDKNGCSAVSTTTISQPSRIQLSLSPSDATCFGGNNGWIQEVTGGGTAPYVNAWSTVPVQSGSSVSGLLAGTYTLTVTDASGCQTQSTATILQPPAIKMMATGSSTICAGQPASLYVQASGGSGSFQYTWNNGVGAGPSHVVSPAVTTSYIVNATDNAGCNAPPDTVVVKVLALSPAYLSMSPPAAMCIGAQAQVAAYVNPMAGAVTYSWNAGLGSGPGPYVVSPASTMTYTVSVTNTCGVSISGTVRVQVNPLPVVSLRPQAIAGCAGTTLSMSNQVLNPGATYQWTFGDGSGSTLATPLYPNRIVCC